LCIEGIEKHPTEMTDGRVQTREKEREREYRTKELAVLAATSALPQ